MFLKAVQSKIPNKNYVFVYVPYPLCGAIIDASPSKKKARTASLSNFMHTYFIA
jgi:hypothetical protein